MGDVKYAISSPVGTGGIPNGIPAYFTIADRLYAVASLDANLDEKWVILEATFRPSKIQYVY